MLKKIKTIIFCLITFCTACVVNIAEANNLYTPRVFAYYTGWSDASIPDTKFNEILLAFALLKGHFYSDYSASGNFQLPAAQGPYKKWNDWAKKWQASKDGNGLAIVSYGGATNPEFRKTVITANLAELQAIAGEIKGNIDKYYFDGVDLDIEDWWSYDFSDNSKFAANLAILVKELKKALVRAGKAYILIEVTVGYTAAGYGPSGGYTGSMQPYFSDQEAMAATDTINIMSYDIKEVSEASEILNSFVNTGVEKQKLMFGIDTKITPNAILKLGSFIKQNLYGGLFLWAIGTDAPQIVAADINYMKQSLSVAE